MTPEEKLSRLLGGYAGNSAFGLTLDGQVEWKDVPEFIETLQKLVVIETAIARLRDNARIV